VTVIRVVPDTNILISGFFWAGYPSRLLRAAEAGQVQLILSQEMVTELGEVLSRPKFEDRLKAIGKTAEEFVTNFRAVVEIVEASPLPIPVCDDPDDDVILACAVGGKADYIVSGDDDLLRLNSYEAIPIWSVRQFIEYLESLSPQ
jgi:uncharacterized protein